MPDPDYIVCAPATPGAHVIAGSIQSQCELCSQIVWLAPTGLRRVLEGFHVMCVPCLKRRVPVSAEIMEPSPDQIAEIRAHLEARDA